MRDAVIPYQYLLRNLRDQSNGQAWESFYFTRWDQRIIQYIQIQSIQKFRFQIDNIYIIYGWIQIEMAGW